MGLSDEELQKLNKDLEERAPLPASISRPEAVEPRHVVWAFVEVAAHSSSIDSVWEIKSNCKTLVDKLSPEELLAVASIMIEARDTKDWSKLANDCALVPFHRSATVTAALCSPRAGSTRQCTV